MSKPETNYHWPLADEKLEKLARKITAAVLNESGDLLDLLAVVRRVLAEEVGAAERV